MTILFSTHTRAFDDEIKAQLAAPTHKRKQNLPLQVEHAAGNGGVTRIDVERLIGGGNEMVRINYLERGLLASRSVCRIRIAAPFGSSAEYGTGFLIGPGLLLTNNHVIASELVSKDATAEFGYESDAKGSLRQATRFRLDPTLAFATDATLDYTLVGVEPTSEDGKVALSSFGFLRLQPALHKVEELQWVTIIQHPNGDEKYVAIRENQVIKIGDDKPELASFIWYRSDTARGSSGAAAFNDAWQVVALHHRAVPDSKEENGRTYYRTNDAAEPWILKEEAEASEARAEKVIWIANEGVRVSSIVEGMSKQAKAGTASGALIEAFLSDATGGKPYPGVDPRDSIAMPETAKPGLTQESASVPLKPLKTAVRDISWYDREGLGYNEDFLGVKLSLPDTSDAVERFGARAKVKGSRTGELKYQNFSVVMCKTRRLAFFTAVNINGKRWTNLERGNDKWYFDPRIDLELQVGEDFYGNEPHLVQPKKGWFDRGHLVRRLDPVWGLKAIAEYANEDTFHFTNCAPQYFGFNQGETRWQGLENFILDNVDSENVLATVFTGPVFREDDELHRGVYIPQYFWKVVVVKDGDGQLLSSGYAVDQKKYASGIPFEVLPVGKYRDFHTSIASIEEQTGLRFDADIKKAEVTPKPGQKTPFSDPNV